VRCNCGIVNQIVDAIAEHDRSKTCRRKGEETKKPGTAICILN
jgi:hypothetical protein